MEAHRHRREDLVCRGIVRAHPTRRSARVVEKAFSAGARLSYTMEGLITRRLDEKRLIGVEIGLRVGVAELIGVGVGGVVGARILDALEMGLDHAQTARGDLTD